MYIFITYLILYASTLLPSLLPCVLQLYVSWFLPVWMFSKTLHEKAFHQVWINVLRPFSAAQGNPTKQGSLHASPNPTHENDRQEC